MVSVQLVGAGNDVACGDSMLRRRHSLDRPRRVEAGQSAALLVSRLNDVPDFVIQVAPLRRVFPARVRDVSRVLRARAFEESRLDSGFWKESASRRRREYQHRVLVCGLFNDSQQPEKTSPASLRPSHTKAARNGWLRNTPAGSTVFHTDWDDFPKLFFYNTHNTYILGLDPDFMRLKNAPLYYKYEDVTQGRVRDIEDTIREEFGCEYVFTDNEHREFINIANQSPRMQKVFSDRYTTVYRILEKAPQTQSSIIAGGCSHDKSFNRSSRLQ